MRAMRPSTPSRAAAEDDRAERDIELAFDGEAECRSGLRTTPAG